MFRETHRQPSRSGKVGARLISPGNSRQGPSFDEAACCGNSFVRHATSGQDKVEQFRTNVVTPRKRLGRD